MLKPTANYKMSKDGKRYLATLTDAHKRGLIKNTIVQSELYSLIQPKREKREPRDNRAANINATPDADSLE
jgi:hypothetical protein